MHPDAFARSNEQKRARKQAQTKAAVKAELKEMFSKGKQKVGGVWKMIRPHDPSKEPSAPADNDKKSEQATDDGNTEKRDDENE